MEVVWQSGKLTASLRYQCMEMPQGFRLRLVPIACLMELYFKELRLSDNENNVHLKSIVHGSSILSFVVIVCPVFIVFISANTAVKDLLFRFLVTSNDPVSCLSGFHPW